jgi:hypothetical protein
MCDLRTNPFSWRDRADHVANLFTQAVVDPFSFTHYQKSVLYNSLYEFLRSGKDWNFDNYLRSLSQFKGGDNILTKLFRFWSDGTGVFSENDNFPMFDESGSIVFDFSKLTQGDSTSVVASGPGGRRLECLLPTNHLINRCCRPSH